MATVSRKDTITTTHIETATVLVSITDTDAKARKYKPSQLRGGAIELAAGATFSVDLMHTLNSDFVEVLTDGSISVDFGYGPFALGSSGDASSSSMPVLSLEGSVVKSLEFVNLGTAKVNVIWSSTTIADQVFDGTVP